MLFFFREREFFFKKKCFVSCEETFLRNRLPRWSPKFSLLLLLLLHHHSIETHSKKKFQKMSKKKSISPHLRFHPSSSHFHRWVLTNFFSPLNLHPFNLSSRNIETRSSTCFKISIPNNHIFGSNNGAFLQPVHSPASGKTCRTFASSLNTSEKLISEFPNSMIGIELIVENFTKSREQIRFSRTSTSALSQIFSKISILIIPGNRGSLKLASQATFGQKKRIGEFSWIGWWTSSRLTVWKAGTR